jgi:hypothetical protein
MSFIKLNSVEQTILKIFFLRNLQPLFHIMHNQFLFAAKILHKHKTLIVNTFLFAKKIRLKN